MDKELRLEQPSDYAETENLMREAFWNHFVPGCDEHYLTHIMRDDPAFLPELDFVAVHEGRIVGSIMYVRGLIEGDDGSEHEILTLGPVAVLPEFQGKGIGATLIEHTASLARELGYRAIFLCGDPAYYVRQKFVDAESFGIRTADDKYMAALQVYELVEGALASARGRYLENSVYEVDKALAEEFDKNFPPKEKISGTSSQKRFEELVAMQRNAF